MQNQTDLSVEKSNKIYYFGVYKDLFTDNFMILEYGVLKENLIDLERKEILKKIKKQREDLEN